MSIIISYNFHRVLRHLLAGIFSLPNGLVIWFTIMYPVIIITGDIMGKLLHGLTLGFGITLVYIWCIYDAGRPAEVSLRGSRLGLILSLLLPFTTLIVFGFLEAGWIDRQGEYTDPIPLTHFEMIMVATAVAAGLAVVCAGISKLSYWRLEK